MTETPVSTDISLTEILQALAEKHDLDLRGYKHSTLQRRLRKRMGQVGISRFADYLERVRQDATEKNVLLNTVLINITHFFRDPLAWDTFGREALYPMLSNRDPRHPLRAWVAGCSTGEEVYTLAMMLSEYYGPSISLHPIKIYATDIDDDALATARRGEYPADRMRGLTPDLRAKYFRGGTMLRVNRELRRMAIFGHSDLFRNAPISHVDLILCRNVLIYFDANMQKKIFKRLHYALQENGVLFLGKAESKLSESALFEAVDSRWRIFRKAGSQEPRTMTAQNVSLNDGDSAHLKELSLLRLYHRSLLDALGPGVVLLNEEDFVVTDNDSALKLWGLSGSNLAGKPVKDTALATRCPDLPMHLAESKKKQNTVQFECSSQVGGNVHNLRVTIRPILGDSGLRAGSILYTEDISHKEHLESAVEQLESTGEELQSANEELETTNEELQSLNEELENMNEELEQRTRELDSLNSRYAATLEQMPWPVTLVDNNERIQFWNSAAQELFGLAANSVIGLNLSQLPIDNGLLKTLVRRHAMVLEKLKATSIKDQPFKGNRFGGSFDIHFTPVSRTGTPQSVLIMFGPLQHVDNASKRVTNNSGRTKSSTSAGKRSKAERSSSVKGKSKKITRAKSNINSTRSASAKRKR